MRKEEVSIYLSIRIIEPAKKLLKSLDLKCGAKVISQVFLAYITRKPWKEFRFRLLYSLFLFGYNDKQYFNKLKY